MHVDLYTKSVLTVIAVALSVIAFRGPYALTPVVAQGTDCGGTRMTACHVKGVIEIDAGMFSVPVYVKNLAR